MAGRVRRCGAQRSCFSFGAGRGCAVRAARRCGSAVPPAPSHRVPGIPRSHELRVGTAGHRPPPGFLASRCSKEAHRGRDGRVRRALCAASPRGSREHLNVFLVSPYRAGGRVWPSLPAQGANVTWGRGVQGTWPPKAMWRTSSSTDISTMPHALRYSRQNGRAGWAVSSPAAARQRSERAMCQTSSNPKAGSNP